MNKHCCILCGKKISSDQKCTITVKGKRSGFDVEEKKEVCLECMLTTLGISNDERTEAL